MRAQLRQPHRLATGLPQLRARPAVRGLGVEYVREALPGAWHLEDGASAGPSGGAWAGPSGRAWTGPSGGAWAGPSGGAGAEGGAGSVPPRPLGRRRCVRLRRSALLLAPEDVRDARWRRRVFHCWASDPGRPAAPLHLLRLRGVDRWQEVVLDNLRVRLLLALQPALLLLRRQRLLLPRPVLCLHPLQELAPVGAPRGRLHGRRPPGRRLGHGLLGLCEAALVPHRVLLLLELLLPPLERLPVDGLVVLAALLQRLLPPLLLRHRLLLVLLLHALVQRPRCAPALRLRPLLHQARAPLLPLRLRLLLLGEPGCELLLPPRLALCSLHPELLVSPLVLTVLPLAALVLEQQPPLLPLPLLCSDDALPLLHCLHLGQLAHAVPQAGLQHRGLRL
mmetsp:Transcript_7795/g.27382  ORF Transcript_7795/g.27382 Transcript_7795/m.27382 type:complete len:393 (-) Transcript_7795:1077-2255(-)